MASSPNCFKMRKIKRLSKISPLASTFSADAIFFCASSRLPRSVSVKSLRRVVTVLPHLTCAKCFSNRGQKHCQAQRKSVKWNCGYQITFFLLGNESGPSCKQTQPRPECTLAEGTFVKWEITQGSTSIPPLIGGLFDSKVPRGGRFSLLEQVYFNSKNTKLQYHKREKH